MKSYRTEDKLNKHLHNGCPKFGQKVDLPSKPDAKEYVKFKNIHKMVKTRRHQHKDIKNMKHADMLINVYLP